MNTLFNNASYFSYKRLIKTTFALPGWENSSSRTMLCLFSSLILQRNVRWTLNSDSLLKGPDQNPFIYRLINITSDCWSRRVISGGNAGFSNGLLEINEAQTFYQCHTHIYNLITVITAFLLNRTSEPCYFHNVSFKHGPLKIGFTQTNRMETFKLNKSQCHCFGVGMPGLV